MKITCVHQSAELYGSDRSFADAVNSLCRLPRVGEVAVILPKPGPLCEILRQEKVIVKFEALWILRKAHGLRVALNLAKLPYAVRRAMRTILTSNVTYINTIVVLDYILASILTRKRPVIIHIREIPSVYITPFFRLVLGASSATVVYNSEATRKHFALGKKKQYVVYNGYHEVPAQEPPNPVNRPLRLLHIGRINAWKGQDLLVEAISALGERDRKNLEVKIVGDAYQGQEGVVRDLQASIARNGLEPVVKLEGFVEDPTPFYLWADVVVIPSRHPEPFGRVAIEGMAFSRPVIAARHGGLTEIVTDQETGWFFEPNYSAGLSRVIVQILQAPSMVEAAGRNSRKRFEELFTLRTTQQKLMSIFKEVAEF